MIVSQADYERWQHMNAARNSTSNESQQATGETETGILSPAGNRQEIAPVTTGETSDGSNLAGEEEQKSFLEQAFERLTLARLGINQEKMDELKEEIEKTETAIENLNAQQPPTAAQKEELNVLKDKLEKLKEALEELVKEANERENKEDATGQNNTEKSLKQYHSIAFLE